MEDRSRKPSYDLGLKRGREGGETEGQDKAVVTSS